MFFVLSAEQPIFTLKFILWEENGKNFWHFPKKNILPNEETGREFILKKNLNMVLSLC